MSETVRVANEWKEGSYDAPVVRVFPIGAEEGSYVVTTYCRNCGSSDAVGRVPWGERWRRKDARTCPNCGVAELRRGHGSVALASPEPAEAGGDE